VTEISQFRRIPCVRMGSSSATPATPMNLFVTGVTLDVLPFPLHPSDTPPHSDVYLLWTTEKLNPKSSPWKIEATLACPFHPFHRSFATPMSPFVTVATPDATLRVHCHLSDDRPNHPLLNPRSHFLLAERTVACPSQPCHRSFAPTTLYVTVANLPIHTRPLAASSWCPPQALNSGRICSAWDSQPGDEDVRVNRIWHPVLMILDNSIT
jgi:hypothetical protein